MRLLKLYIGVEKLYIGDVKLSMREDNVSMRDVKLSMEQGKLDIRSILLPAHPFGHCEARMETTSKLRVRRNEIVGIIGSDL